MVVVVVVVVGERRHLPHKIAGQQETSPMSTHIVSLPRWRFVEQLCVEQSDASKHSMVNAAVCGELYRPCGSDGSSVGWRLSLSILLARHVCLFGIVQLLCTLFRGSVGSTDRPFTPCPLPLSLMSSAAC